MDKIINGIEIPSTPRENFKLSLLNQLKEFTNWKCGMLLSKFKGRYKDKKKLLTEVHSADLFACSAESSFSDDNNIKRRPIRGRHIKIGKIGRFNIRKYNYKG